MNIFDSLRTYGGNWNKVAERNFTDEEIADVASANVVTSQYGLSVCFTMIGGGQHYIPLSNKSSLKSGDSIDVKNAKLITLHRDGNKDITRVEA